MSKWLNWKPEHNETIQNPPICEPTKPSKTDFGGFAGGRKTKDSIIRGGGTAAQPPARCPFNIPRGVLLRSYKRRKPPVVLTLCCVVTDVAKFIQHALDELNARLHSPVQIKAGDSVFELLSKLADCGLELRLEWPLPEKLDADSNAAEPLRLTNPDERPESDTDSTDARTSEGMAL